MLGSAEQSSNKEEEIINKFGILYAGHVDIDNLGFRGTPVNQRWFSDDHLATTFDTAADLAQTADRLGYDTLWFAEHHFQREGYECIPNILMLSVHLAHLTKRLKFGCAFNVTPMWHPLRLAEDYAVADILTDGRVIFGVGRGYHTREVETFGSPLIDNDANRELFEEQVEIILKAFNNRSFSHHGRHYDIPPRVPYRGYQLEEITLVPRPRHLPVECWQPIVSAKPRGLSFMARHGIKGIIGGGAAPGGAPGKVVEAFRDAQAQVGRETELGENLIVGIVFHIAENREKAVAEATPYYEEDAKMFGPLGFAEGLTQEQLEGLENPTEELLRGLPTIESAVRRGEWIVGSPEEIIESLMQLQDTYPGLKEVHVGSGIPTPRSVMLEQLEWFAKEVMPAFKAQEKVPAS